jgi:hypothetical protein
MPVNCEEMKESGMKMYDDFSGICRNECVRNLIQENKITTTFGTGGEYNQSRVPCTQTCGQHFDVTSCCVARCADLRGAIYMRASKQSKMNMNKHIGNAGKLSTHLPRQGMYRKCFLVIS